MQSGGTNTIQFHQIQIYGIGFSLYVYYVYYMNV